MKNDSATYLLFSFSMLFFFCEPGKERCRSNLRLPTRSGKATVIRMKNSRRPHRRRGRRFRKRVKIPPRSISLRLNPHVHFSSFFCCLFFPLSFLFLFSFVFLLNETETARPQNGKADFKKEIIQHKQRGVTH